MTTPRQELEALRKWKAEHTAKNKPVQQQVKKVAVQQPKPATQKTVEVKQDKRRANKSLSFDYSSPYFTKALQQSSNPQ